MLFQDFFFSPNLAVFCLYIMASNFVFMGFLCLGCVCFSVSKGFPVFFFHFFLLVCFYFILLLLLSLRSLFVIKWQKTKWDWVGGEVERICDSLERGNHNQNILNEKNIFQLKMFAVIEIIFSFTFAWHVNWGIFKLCLLFNIFVCSGSCWLTTAL